MTRRRALALFPAGAALAAAASEADLRGIIKHHDGVVEETLAKQVTDPKSRGYGSLAAGNATIPDRGIYSARAAATVVEQCAAAYLHPESKFHGDRLMVERIGLAIGFLNRAQHPDGFIDLLETNFDSPPDTGFTVQNLATGACLAHRAGEHELVALCEPFLRKAAAGLAIGGIHTPNHRWVVSSALAQVNELFPDPRYVRRIDQWLAEGIDIDEDGQYTERSTAVYNIVCDRAFVVLAAKLKRPELLDPVRRNLQSMLYLMHANYEVVTEISRRQDRNQRGMMSGYWFPLRYLAARDHNGQFATIANHFTPAFSSLPAMMEYPEMAGPMPAAAALPSDFRKEMRALGIVRFRRGAMSATLLSDNARFFTLRQGDAVIQAVRFASAFFGKGQFSGAEVQSFNGGFALTQDLEGPYYQPFDPPRRVTPANWSKLREERTKSPICRLRQSASIMQTQHGFRVRMQSEGTAGVPVAIEIGFRDGGQLEGCEQDGAGAALLRAGTGSYTVGGDRIRFGPGLCEHRYTDVRGALEKLPGLSVYLTAFTPVDHSVEFDLG